jgi:hypothetical protein
MGRAIGGPITDRVHMPITAPAIIGRGITAGNDTTKPGKLRPPGFFMLDVSIQKQGLDFDRGPVRSVVGSVAGVSERGQEIRFAFALEFFLGRSEVGDADRNFFPLLGGPVFLFGHAHPFLILVPPPLTTSIGA